MKSSGMFKNVYGIRMGTAEEARQRVGGSKGLKGLEIKLKWGEMKTELLARGKEEVGMRERVIERGAKRDDKLRFINKKMYEGLWGGRMVQWIVKKRTQRRKVGATTDGSSRNSMESAWLRLGVIWKRFRGDLSEGVTRKEGVNEACTRTSEKATEHSSEMEKERK